MKPAYTDALSYYDRYKLDPPDEQEQDEYDRDETDKDGWNDPDFDDRYEY
jgi:hypothetical protein